MCIRDRLGSPETFAAQAPITLESQYGDRQTIPVSAWFGPHADLATSGAGLPREMAPGDALSTTVTLVNHGPSEALTVTVPISLTGDATLVGLAHSVGITCALGGGVVCRAQNWPEGQSLTVTLGLEANGTISDAGTDPLVASLRAGISTSSYDPNKSNDTWLALWGGWRVYLPLATRS